MESTRMHCLAVVAGLWMTSSTDTLAQDNTRPSAGRETPLMPAPSADAATANGAIDLAAVDETPSLAVIETVKEEVPPPGGAPAPLKPEAHRRIDNASSSTGRCDHRTFEETDRRGIVPLPHSVCKGLDVFGRGAVVVHPNLDLARLVSVAKP